MSKIAEARKITRAKITTFTVQHLHPKWATPLKSTHPLWKILEKCTIGGCEFVNALTFYVIFRLGVSQREYTFDLYQMSLFKVGVNPSLNKEMWLLMHLITKKTCTKMYKSIHFWNQKNQMNPMVATDFCKIMRFSRNSSVTMVKIEFFLESITKIWFY